MDLVMLLDIRHWNQRLLFQNLCKGALSTVLFSHNVRSNVARSCLLRLYKDLPTFDILDVVTNLLLANLKINLFVNNSIFTYHWYRDHEVIQKAVLCPSLLCFLTVRLRLDNLHALVDRRKNNGFKGSRLEILIVKYFVKDVEGNDSL